MIKKKYSFKNKNQIWRLHISESDNDKLVIETREMDTEKKEIYFHCLDLRSGKKIFADLQLEEKSWIGIETTYKDVILFHKYADPTMPGHKSIIAYDITKQKLLWEHELFMFRFVYENKVYASMASMSGEKFYEIDYLSGEIKNPEGYKMEEILGISQLAEKDYSNYKFPEIFDSSFLSDITDKIKNETNTLNVSGNIEFIDISEMLFLNFHYINEKNKVTNQFKALDKFKNKVIFTEVLNKSTQAYVPDSFFIFKNFLLLLKEKKEVIVFEIN